MDFDEFCEVFNTGPAFEFDADEHKYTLNGKKIPSVSELVAVMGEDMDDFDDLVDIAIANAAERGTALHAYLAYRLNGGAAEDYDELPAAYSGYAEAVDRFVDEHDFEPAMIETAMYGDTKTLTFAGTPDYVGKFDGKLCILDYKFVATVAKSRVSAQLNAYLQLCWQNCLEPEELYCVWLKKDGTYTLYPVAVNQERFELCCQVYAAAHAKHPRGQIV